MDEEGFVSQDRLGLFDTPPNRQQVRFSSAVVGLLFAAFLLILPLRNLRLAEIDAFIPMVEAVMFVSGLITGALLYAQAAVFRSRALTVLATGYTFAALLVVPHALSFPGAFAPQGLLGGGLNTTSWLGNLRRAALPVAVICYVLLKQGGAARPPEGEPAEPRIAVAILAAVTLAPAVTLLITVIEALLPPFFLNRADLIYSNAIRYEVATFAFFSLATAMLYRRRQSVLDMWLLVALSGWLIQSLLIMTLHGRFTAGWYCFYLLMLCSDLVVMLALIAESIRLYARLARSTLARRWEREARLMSMDALTAAIYHEVVQPLSALSANGMASLHWLTGEHPEPEKAAKALRAAIEAGQRTADVIKSIRTMFAKRPDAATEFNLNDLVRETASLLDRELKVERVSLRLALDDALPPVLADRTQLRQVLLNLFTNAIESLSATPGRPRRLAIRSAPLSSEDVLIEVSDSGVGIAPDKMARVFDAFFTTKATGTGLGLSLCLNIVEEHGGRLWVSPGDPCGATFHLQLPRRGPLYESFEAQR